MLVLRGMSLKNYAGEYWSLIDKIFSSVMPTVTKEQAVIKVEALPEVVEYKAMLAKTEKKEVVEVEDGDGEWNVHVFEVVGIGADSHTATFNWYRVDKQTGAVEKEF